ncbi:hypothetical protein BDW22DRAFT_1336759 [Trametopsis cervina]|nr:hypothetical protein BDW22DRAFT_1336759 [Trametopsis cervina]
MAEASTGLQSGESPFVEAPAPWHNDGELFWLFGYNSAKQPLKPSSYGPLEGASSFADPEQSGAFKGGLSAVMIVRYKSSPVGPYEEIAWSPGNFDIPPTGKKALRVTRIYVSTLASVYNGRKNWNVCKQLAYFKFVPSAATSPGALPYSRIEVSPPDAPERPFFVIDLSTTFLGSNARIPFNSALSPVSLEIVCPPLPQSPKWAEDGCVGTNRWVSINSGMKGKAGLFKAKGGLEDGKMGDDVGFPDVQPWSVGMWLNEFKLEFPVGVELGKKDK